MKRSRKGKKKRNKGKIFLIKSKVLTGGPDTPGVPGLPASPMGPGAPDGPGLP